MANKKLTFDGYRFSDGTNLDYSCDDEVKLYKSVKSDNLEDNWRPITKAHLDAVFKRKDIKLHLDVGPFSRTVTLKGPVTCHKIVNAMKRFYVRKLTKKQKEVLRKSRFATTWARLTPDELVKEADTFSYLTEDHRFYEGLAKLRGESDTYCLILGS